MNVAIVVAAGQGKRLGAKKLKQFLKLDGIPIIIHTLKRFEQCEDIDQVIVVLPSSEVAKFPALARKYDLRKVGRCVAGGMTRAESVRRGFISIPRDGVNVVAIHDGVRPFVTPAEISLTVKAVKKNRAAILAATVSDTIKVVRNGKVVFTPPREDLRRALTPQCFDYSLLKRAFAKSSTHPYTDESMFVERAISPKVVTIVEGNSRNIKITQPEDIAIAKVILRQNPEFKIKN